MAVDLVPGISGVRRAASSFQGYNPREPRCAWAAWRVGAALAGLLLGSVAGNMNANIVSVAFPTMMQAYHVPFEQVVWIGIGATLGLAALLPPAGRLGDVYGYRRLYLVGTLIFLGGCALSVLDLPFWVIVVTRVLQGVASSTVTPAVLAIIARDYPRERRGQLVGLWALAGGLGIALAPSLGGVLVATLGWHAVFGAAVPVLGLALVLVRLFVSPDPPRDHRRFEDGLGAGLLTGTILSGVLALQQTAQPVIPFGWLVPICIALLLGSLLVARERGLAQPFLPPSLFSTPGFVVTMLVAHVQMLTMAAVLALAPLYLIGLRGLRPEVAGLVVLPLPLALLGSTVFGKWADRVGPRPLVLAGTGLIGTFGLLGTRWGAETPIMLVAVELGLAGIGMALIQTPLTALVTSIVPPAHIGVSTGFFNMVRFLGLVVGPAVAGIVVSLSSTASPPATNLTPAFLMVSAVASLGMLLALRVPRNRSAGTKSLRLPSQPSVLWKGSVRELRVP